MSALLIKRTSSCYCCFTKAEESFIYA